MASSSSSLSQESAVKTHPYQYNDLPGPKGAFEARQVEGGFYVRVDMPGVPPDGLKLNKYSDTRTVTFSGNAPIIWENLDSPDVRVYGGYVILDRDPLELDIKTKLKNGCLRLFFPNAEGSLQYLTPKKSTREQQQPPTEENDPLDDGDPMSLLSIEYALSQMNDGHPDKKELIEMCHALRKDGYQYKSPGSDQMRGCHGGNFAHINPYLLSGVEGVYEHKIVKGDADGSNDSLMYVRIDMPGISHKQYYVKVDNGSQLMYGGDGKKESRFDEGGRKYISMMYLKCPCCRYVKVKDQLNDGVLRILFCKIRVSPRSARK